MHLTRHGHAARAARQGLLERQLDRVVQIGAAFRRPGGRALLKDFGEQVAEGRRVGTFDADGKIEALEPERPCILGGRRRTVHVVPTATVGIAQCLVGLGDLPELCGGHPVPRVDVRVVTPRQTLVRALDVVQRRAAFEAQEKIEIHQRLNRYCFPSSTTSASMTSPLFCPLFCPL